MATWTTKVNQRASGAEQTITNEARTIGEDTANYVFLTEVPLQESPSSVTVVQGATTYTEVTGSPSANQYQVIYSGRLMGAILFNSGDNGKAVTVSYKGKGSNVFARDINNLQTLKADGLIDSTITPTAASPYFVQTSDVDKRLVVTSGSAAAVTFPANTNIAVGSRIGVAAYGSSTVTLQSSWDGFNPNANSVVSAIAVQSDGKIIIGGAFTTVGGTTRNRIARLNSDGTLDTGFNPNVSATYVWAIAIQSDGKILIGGDFTTVGGTTRNRMARLNSDGTLDTGYNPNVGTTAVRGIAIQSDGKAVIVGNFTTVGGTTRNRVARINTDGTLDTGFNPNANAELRAVVIQSDGKIIIGGDIGNIGGTVRLGLARLNTDGTLDTGYTGGSGTGINGLSLQSDGKVLIAANTYVRRYTTAGANDTTFSATFAGASGWYANAVLVLADQSIIVTGSFDTVNSVTRNLAVDLSSTGATTSQDFGLPTTNYGSALAQQSDGKVIVGGFFSASLGGTTRNNIARFAGGTDVVNAPYASPLSVPQYGNIVLEKRATDTWVIAESNCS